MKLHPNSGAATVACPSWLGERLDLGYAIDVLHPLAATDSRVRPGGRAARTMTRLVRAAAKMGVDSGSLSIRPRG